MGTTKIAWCASDDGTPGKTWNPVMGCTPVSEACEHCYARSIIRRFAGCKGWPASPDTVTLFPERLQDPLRWKKPRRGDRPRRVFVCSMSDLFHEDVPFEFIHEVYERMAIADRHTFMILTKRPERMREFYEWEWDQDPDDFCIFNNIWLGVTAENQARADERIPTLLQIPAAVHFVSIEPMLGPVTMISTNGILNEPYPYPILDWVIVGGETGPGARLMRYAWAQDIERQCDEAGVPMFFKQWGSADRHGDEYDAWERGWDKRATDGGHVLSRQEGCHQFPEVTR